MAPFIGKKNIFSEEVDGHSVVKVKSIVGAALAPFLLSTMISLGEGVSILRKIPLVGRSLQEIFDGVFGGIHALTVPSETNPHARPGTPIPE